MSSSWTARGKSSSESEHSNDKQGKRTSSSSIQARRSLALHIRQMRLEEKDDISTSSEEDDSNVVCYICSNGDSTRYNKIILCDRKK